MPSFILRKEEECNPQGYADYLENEHYHHSDKGCVIEMEKQMGNRKGEPSVPGLVKKCLTHGVVCSKTGWEMGMYLGKKSNFLECNMCGCEIFEFRRKYCPECSKIAKFKNDKRHQQLGKEFRQNIRKLKASN